MSFSILPLHQTPKILSFEVLDEGIVRRGGGGYETRGRGNHAEAGGVEDVIGCGGEEGRERGGGRSTTSTLTPAVFIIVVNVVIVVKYGSP